MLISSVVMYFTSKYIHGKANNLTTKAVTRLIVGDRRFFVMPLL